MDHHNLPNLLERTEPGIILFDDTFRVTHVNWALLRIFAETPHEKILEQNLLEMHRGPAGEKLQELVSMVRDPSRQVSISVRRMSGSREIFVMLKMIPLLDQKLAKSLHCCLIYDITALISTPQSGFIKVPVTAGGEILLFAPEEAPRMLCRGQGVAGGGCGTRNRLLGARRYSWGRELDSAGRFKRPLLAFHR